MPERGRLTEWNDDRGFGFITPLAGGPRRFVHVSQFPRDLRRPQLLDLVTYEPSTDERGRPQARGVGFLAPTRSRREPATRYAPETRSPTSAAQHLVALGFFAVLLVLVAVGALPGAVAVLYLVVSVLAFATYAQDKTAAQSHGRRTPEATLHMLALLGGWPGALVAQAALRHKTRKQPFRTIFFATVALNCALLVLLAAASNAAPS